MEIAPQTENRRCCPAEFRASRGSQIEAYYGLFLAIEKLCQVGTGFGYEQMRSTVEQHLLLPAPSLVTITPFSLHNKKAQS